MLGKRTGYDKNHGMPYRPHNVTNVVLGTVFLWVGWFGFNGGSALGMNIRAIVACFNTNLAASMGGLAWTLLDYRLERKWSTIGFCSGAISGLVAITPAAGFVPIWAALIIGVVGGIVCNFATKLKFLIGIDDALDIFAVHGVGGMAGNIMTGVFAAYVAPLYSFFQFSDTVLTIYAVLGLPSLTAPSGMPLAGSSTTGFRWATSSPAPAPPLPGPSP
jgi:Amt family ammonium transporter